MITALRRFILTLVLELTIFSVVAAPARAQSDSRPNPSRGLSTQTVSDSQEHTTLAVLSLQDTLHIVEEARFSVPRVEKRGFRPESLEDALFRAIQKHAPNRYTILAREIVRERLAGAKERGQNSIAEYATAIGANTLVTAYVDYIADNLQLNLNLFEARSGRLIRSSNVRAVDQVTLEAETSTAAKDLLEPLRRGPLSLTLGVTAGVAAVTGVTFALLAKSANAEWRNASTPSEWLGARNRLERDTTGANAAYAVAAVAAVGALTLLLFTDRY